MDIMEKNNYDLGKEAMKYGRFETAEGYFDKLICQDPTHAEAWMLRGKAKSLIADSQYDYDVISDLKDEAIDDINHAIELDPNLFEAYYERGQVCCSTGNFEEACVDYSMVIKIKPDAYVAYYARGHAFFENNQYEESIGDFNLYINKHVFRDYKLKISAKNELARAYIKLKRYEEAISVFSSIIELNIHDAEAYSDRGFAHLNLGNTNEALADFRAALKVDPLNKKALASIDLVHEIFQFENMKGERTVSDFATSIIELLEYDDKHDEIYKEASECIRIYPNFYLGYIYRALVYGDKNEVDKAKADLNMSLILKPNNIMAQTLINSF